MAAFRFKQRPLLGLGTQEELSNIVSLIKDAANELAKLAGAENFCCKNTNIVPFKSSK